VTKYFYNESYILDKIKSVIDYLLVMLLTLKFYRERKIMKLEILKNLMGKSQVKRNGFVRNEKKKMYNNNSIGWC